MARFFLCFAILVALLGTPLFALAQNPLDPGYLIVCGAKEGGAGQTDACGFDDLLTLVQRIINVIIALAVLVTPLLVMYAGALLLTRGDDPNKVTKAKEIFKTTIIGFIIILAGWLIVSVILGGLQAVNPLLEDVRPIN